MAVFKLGITVGRFFTSLKSQRRLGLLKNVSESVRSEADKASPPSDDPFAEHSELDGFGIYASDGHVHGLSE